MMLDWNAYDAHENIAHREQSNRMRVFSSFFENAFVSG